MKNFTLSCLSLVFISSILFLGCSNDDDTEQTPEAIEYESVVIGSQKWMLENLDVETYRNGDTIPRLQEDQDWSELTTGAWSLVTYEGFDGLGYGKLYNWYAVNDPRGLAPEGWRIPTKEDWLELSIFVGGNEASGKLKSTGTIEAGDGLWYHPNTGATNESGFTALPAPLKEISGIVTPGYYAKWWCSNEYDSEVSWTVWINYDSEYINGNTHEKYKLFSVRCIKDFE